MQDKGIAATFHYVPLHISTMGKKYGKIRLPITENVYKKVVRLPLFTDLKKKDLNKILKYIKIFFND